MHCLLCHEKIPRLRAWTGKSEFCCDDHAELYKRQTMERLLVDVFAEREPVIALPLGGVKPLPRETPPEEKLSLPERLPEPEQSKKKPLSSKSSAAAIPLPPATTNRDSPVEYQSGDDALAALRALASEASPQTKNEMGGFDDYAALESFEGLSQLEAAASELTPDPIDEAPELEFEAFEGPELVQAAPSDFPELPELPAEFIEALESGDISLEDAPELHLEELELPDLPGPGSAIQAALQPPDPLLDFADEPLDVLDAPEPDLAALEAEESILAAAEALPDPPEFSFDAELEADAELELEDELELELEAETETETKPVAASSPVGKRPRPVRPAPRLRPAADLRPLDPAALLPDSSTPSQWGDALVAFDPDRASLLGPIKAMELRKSSLNGTASGTFDPAVFKPSKKIAAIPFLIAEPNDRGYTDQPAEPTPPAEMLAWPQLLHVALGSSTMRFSQATSREISMDSLLVAEPPQISSEFLNRVAFQGRVLEPKGSAILSLPERYVSASAPAEEDFDETGASSVDGTNRDETEGGERAHVADLF